MPSIEPINTQRHSTISDLLAADVVGASAALGADYWLQKDAFKHADRYIPLLEEQSKQLAENGLESQELKGLMQYLSDKKVNNFSLVSAAIKGAAVTGLLFLGYHWIKNTAGKNDKDFGEKTATAAGIGAVGGGLASYFSQKSLLTSASSLRDTVQNLLVATVTEGSDDAIKHVAPLSDSFKNITASMGDGKIIKSVVAHSALRGAAYIGSAYVLFRGIKALFNLRPQPKIQVIEVPDEVAKRMFKTSDRKRSQASEEIIDV
ncbi:MAG: hypothetical protein K6A44_03845 [bacterium]|nr:hypothetical protein [bacterium]